MTNLTIKGILKRLDEEFVPRQLVQEGEEVLAYSIDAEDVKQFLKKYLKAYAKQKVREEIMYMEAQK